MIVTFDKHVADQTQNKEGMGIIERVENEIKRMAFEDGFGEGIAKGKLLTCVQNLAALRSTIYFSSSTNEDLATTFQLPVAWVERIRKGDVPGQEEVEKFLAGKHGNGNSH